MHRALGAELRRQILPFRTVVQDPENAAYGVAPVGGGTPPFGFFG